VKKLDATIIRLVELAAIARKDGMMALEGQDVPDKFLKRACNCLLMALMRRKW
jgi:chemotaxis protein MotA